jgi:hypothetical protein
MSLLRRERRGPTAIGTALLGAAALAMLAGAPAGALAQQDASTAAKSTAAKKSKSLKFDMVVSAGASSCVPKATASVTVAQSGEIGQKLTIKASGLPKDTGFDLFVLQVPTTPFGLAWYIGDLQTNSSGKASATFVTIFSIETFGLSLAPVTTTRTHTAAPFPDATTSPTLAPLHTYHLGLWFDSPDGATAAGCASTETPFNGDHTAGIQVLNTSTFGNDDGPLKGFPTQ